MADAIITRKTAPSGTKDPTISLVSKDIKTITITITNNEDAEALIYYDLNDGTPDTLVTLAAGATSSNIVYSDLTPNLLYTITAFAVTDGKKASNIVTSNISTDAIAVPSINVTSITSSVINFTVTNNEDYQGDVYYALDVAEPNATFVTLAATATSSGLSFTGLTPNGSYTVYARTLISGVYSTVASNVQTLPDVINPSVSFSSIGPSSATMSLTNNDTATATIYYDTANPPVANSVSVGGGGTSNISLSGLAQGTTFTYYLQADLNGVLSDVVSGQFTTLVENYSTATGGSTTEYNVGNVRYKQHTFTGNGTFTVTSVGDNVDDRNKLEYIIVAGGGAGGGRGGGGAGGYLSSFAGQSSGRNSGARSKITASATNYGITIGAGGTQNGGYWHGYNGANSSALGQTATGGGGGASSYNLRVYAQNGSITAALDNGGSGGGGSTGGSNPPGGLSNQGFGGGSSSDGTSGGGGGGAGGAGSNAAYQVAGNGGNGLHGRASGGAGRTYTTQYVWGSSNSGGGRAYAAGSGNTGGGGSSGGESFPGNGGSGVVLVRYKIFKP